MNSHQSTRPSLETPSPLLPTAPAARTARWTAWLLLGAFASAGAFAFLVKLPEVVSASFVLEPEAGADPVQAPLAGELAKVCVHEGQGVNGGDELFELRSDEIRNWQARLSQAQEDQRALQERVRKLDEAHAAELGIKDAELAQAEREVSYRQKYLDTGKDFLRRAQKLADDKLLSEVELMREQLQAAGAERDLVLSEKAKQQVNLQRQELETSRARERIEEAAEFEKLKIQIVTLQRQVADCTGDFKSVRAPYAAVVLALKQRTPGSVVATGAELCQLAPADARPLARLSLPETSLSRLKRGQLVRLRYEAYPYQRYGSVPATLEWISPAAVTSGAGPGFQATCKLAAGGPGPIRARVGMRGMARILVGRRTLIEKALEPLRTVEEQLGSG